MYYIPGTNSANADLLPAESSPTGGAALLFVVRCDCPVEFAPGDWLVAYGPPKLVALDVAKLQLTELQERPAAPPFPRAHPRQGYVPWLGSHRAADPSPRDAVLCARHCQGPGLARVRLSRQYRDLG